MVFVHEFAGSSDSWQPQIDALSGAFRCIAFNVRGWPPSEVPETGAGYGQRHAADDVAAVIAAVVGAPAHLIGLSVGSMAALHCTLHHPELVASITLCGCGPGAPDDDLSNWNSKIEDFARKIEAGPAAKVAEDYAATPARRRLANKRPGADRAFREQLADRPGRGPVLTLRHMIAHRPRLSDLAGSIGKITCPVLIICGDEDVPCLASSRFLHATIPDAGLCLLPCTGHAVNQEEPALFK